MIDTTGLRACTIEKPSRRFCGQPSAPRMPFPICPEHAITLFAELAQIVDANHDNELLGLMMGKEHLESLAAIRYRKPTNLPVIRQTHEVVYYLLIDGLVKIGYARDLDNRLRAYPPTTQLLATEDGGRELEKVRLSDFAEYRVAGREWFTPGPRLREHIESLPSYEAA